ncbi:hypothetical protein B0H66DRAFT_539210 [Apodospora peruviana]|uniref:2'-phosphotransferase n=1 Tax=Apodospora peruviana TaxID=516989 RepID=A0AAE0MF33_9PEZI|nr:hypothetical protein B0H66DRAFT_539210 [Apodospora peruviana]
MATAVAVPFSAINNQLGGVLPPSALVHNSPRHGRSRGMSFKGKNGRGRGYSLVEERDVTIAKALMFALKRTITEENVDEDDEAQDNLVEDSEGWVDVSDALEYPKLAALEVDLDDIQRVVANATKTRFSLRQTPETEADDPASWEIRRITNRDSISGPTPVGPAITIESGDLPDFIVYETSYQRYPLILSSGAITRAPTGTQYLSFQPVTVAGDGTESSRNCFTGSGSETAEVSIWIHLRSALYAEPKISWHRTDSGAIITADEVPKSLWKKALARRPDIGLLFEDGEVRKEIPASLRGRGAKGRGKKGDKASFKRDGSGDDSGSASEE